MPGDSTRRPYGPGERSSLPPLAERRLVDWMRTIDDEAPGHLIAAFAVGSLALDDWTEHSDIDVVGVVPEPAEPETVAQLKRAHERFVKIQPHAAVDGPFVGWGDLQRPPSAVRRAWVLDGRFHHDDGCFELNPVTWHVLATDAIILRGTPTTWIEADEQALRAWVTENLRTYWADTAEQIRVAVGSAPGNRRFRSASLEWAALGAARMLFTYEEGGVVSKSVAGQWAADRLPEHAETFRKAVRLRQQPGEIDPHVLLAACRAIDAVISEVDRS